MYPLFLVIDIHKNQINKLLEEVMNTIQLLKKTTKVCKIRLIDQFFKKKIHKRSHAFWYKHNNMIIVHIIPN